MAIKKVKLNYMSAVSNTPPVEKIPVPSSHMELLNRAIRPKLEQNAREQEEGRRLAEQYIVR